MRLPKEWIGHIAKGIVENLTQKGLMELKISKDGSVRELEQMITEDLLVEDKIDEEVRQILRQYETDIEKGRLDYKKLFTLTKQKLVRERNLIL
ncbi:MAG: DUF507 family protein [Nitrospirota bacterium]